MSLFKGVNIVFDSLENFKTNYYYYWNLQYIKLMQLQSMNISQSKMQCTKGELATCTSHYKTNYLAKIIYRINYNEKLYYYKVLKLGNN